MERREDINLMASRCTVWHVDRTGAEQAHAHLVMRRRAGAVDGLGGDFYNVLQLEISTVAWRGGVTAGRRIRWL